MNDKMILQERRADWENLRAERENRDIPNHAQVPARARAAGLRVKPVLATRASSQWIVIITSCTPAEVTEAPSPAVSSCTLVALSIGWNLPIEWIRRSADACAHVHFPTF